MAGFINMNRDDYFDKGVAPRQRRVHILRWNPSISSFKREGFEFYFSHYKNNLPIDPDDKFDWSVWNWREVMHRDLFIMMQVGQKVNGIVWGGFLGGYPYQYEREDGTMSKSIFFETTVMYMNRIEKTGLMTAEKLIQVIPEVDWLHGHSGELLSIENAEKLGLFLVDEMIKIDEKDEDFYFDTFNEKVYVIADILTFMCPNLKKNLLVMGKTESPRIKNINKLMVRLDDKNYSKWDKIEDHLHLEKLNWILM